MGDRDSHHSTGTRKQGKPIGPISGLLGSATLTAAILLLIAGARLAWTALTDSRLQGSPVWMILAAGAALIFFGLCLLAGAAVMLRPRDREPVQERQPLGSGSGAARQRRYRLHRGSWTSLAIFSFFVLVAWSIVRLFDSEPEGPWMIVEAPFAEHSAGGWPRDRFATWCRTAHYNDANGPAAFEGCIDSKGNIIGEGKWYYPDGTLQAVGSYRDGKLICCFRRFDESGVLVEQTGQRRDRHSE